MKGTRLWQAPGSPIIQGRSRTARPFWEVWLWAGALAQAAVVLVGVALRLGQGDQTLVSAMSAVMLTVFLPALPGAVAGSALGVGLSRSMGWRRPWVAGAAVGIALATITILLF